MNTLSSLNYKDDKFSGAKVVCTPILHTKTVSIGILVRVGSISEDTDSLVGYSHFLEHMIFKGTKRLNFQELNKEFEKQGAYVNAFTGKYYTLFYVHCLQDFALDCLNLLLEMVFQSTLPEKEIEKEKKVVLEEISNYKDNPEDCLLEEFYSHTFLHSFFGNSILGSPKNIHDISYSSLLSYYQKYYVPSNCIISVAGNIIPEKIYETIHSFFKTIPFLESQNNFSIKSPVDFHYGSHTHHRTELEQSHLCLGLSMNNIDVSKHTLKLFNAILGGMSSSRLYLGIREQRALCYSIDSTVYTDPNTGFLSIFASTQVKQTQELLDSILEELISLKKIPITEEELMIAKNQMKSKIAFRQESISQTMIKNASQVFFYGRLIEDNITLEKINQTQLHHFEPIYRHIDINKMSLHILSPANKKQITLKKI